VDRTNQVRNLLAGGQVRWAERLRADGVLQVHNRQSGQEQFAENYPFAESRNHPNPDPRRQVY
jgi:hypothetical protein